MAIVGILPEAAAEIASMPERGRVALNNAIAKLREPGDSLGFPHSSQVQGTMLRELRPRRGNSPWRAFYRRRRNQLFIVTAVGPEAMHNQRKFRRAVTDAQDRLAALETS